MPVTGVIFDCDGTLLDSEAAWLGAQTELTEQAGIELTPEEVDIICTLSIPETGAFFHDRFGLGETPDAVVTLINDYMLERYQYDIEERAGALDFVKALHGLGVVCSVASSTPQALLQVALEKTGFSPYLQVIVSVDDVGVSKRHPEVYDRACALMGTEKSSTWVFEDSAYALHTLSTTEYHTVGIYDSDLAGTLEQLSIADLVIKEFSDLDVAAFVKA